MTAQGGDILAWLNDAITKAEASADSWHDAECSFHETTLIDVSVLQGGATLCDCEGPALVRRRCATDRKMLDRHTPHRFGSAACLMRCEAPHPGVLVCNHDDRAWPCPDITDLADSYGWTAGQTPPTEGDQVT